MQHLTTFTFWKAKSQKMTDWDRPRQQPLRGYTSNLLFLCSFQDNTDLNSHYAKHTQSCPINQFVTRNLFFNVFDQMTLCSCWYSKLSALQTHLKGLTPQDNSAALGKQWLFSQIMFFTLQEQITKMKNL